VNQFESRLAALAGQRKVIKEKIVQLEAQITGGEAQVKAYKAQLALVNKELESIEPLVKQGLIAQPRYLQLHQGEQGRRHDAPDIVCGRVAIGIRNDLCRITLRSDRVDPVDGETVNRIVVGHLSIPAAGFIDLYNQMTAAIQRLTKAGRVQAAKRTPQQLS
jgi:hypothetical protein